MPCIGGSIRHQLSDMMVSGPQVRSGRYGPCSKLSASFWLQVEVLFFLHLVDHSDPQSFGLRGESRFISPVA